MSPKKSAKRVVKVTPKKTPRTRKPDSMSLDEWQIALRREYGREQNFSYKNTGGEPIFSEFQVTNPASGGTYRVAIRGAELGVNFCACPDYQVNTLGTCKHIEWLLAKLAKKRGGKKALEAGYHPPYSEVYLRQGAQRRICFREGAECTPAVRKLAEAYFDAEKVLRPKGLATFERFVREAAESGHEVRVYEDALAFAARMRDDEARRKAIARQFGNGKGKQAFSRLLKTSMYPYQQEGALFAANAGRCLIADDMGLGKTIQAIAAVEILARTAGAERVLVVCPAALKHQWCEEIGKFSKRGAMIVEGMQADRERLYKEDAFYKIVNYDVVHRDLDAIAGWAPDVVILDEAQRIKNWNTRRAKAVKKIESDYALVLTGTPLENRLEELHSIMQFVDRFHLGPLFRFLHTHQHTDAHGKVIGYHGLGEIKESLRPVLVRRRKQEVLHQLPPRTDKHFFVDMTKQQQSIHVENQEIVVKIVAKWKRYGFLSEADQRRLMIALQYMRMSCNSTYLIDKETDHSIKIDECALLLKDLLETPENKAVIFSQWLGTHELLIRRLKAEKIGYAFYNGSLSSKERRAVIDRFKQEPDCRVLLCTDSGGVGLNLQVASVVVNMDQPWNPAVLEQRIGRVHRLGQHRNVQVYHFVSRGTIEQSMLDVLNFKASVFKGVLDGGESEVFLGGSKMKKFMETVEKVSGQLPAEPPVREEVSEFEEAAEPEESGAGTASAPFPHEGSPWEGVLATGLEFLAKLGQAVEAKPGTKTGAKAAPSLANLVTRDEASGRAELRIPLPEGDAAVQVAELLAGLGNALKALGGRR